MFQGKKNTYLSFVIHVTFVSQNHFLDISRCVFFNISYPVFDIVKAFFICDVIYQHYSHCTTIIGSCNCAKALLACSIPTMTQKMRM